MPFSDQWKPGSLGENSRFSHWDRKSDKISLEHLRAPERKKVLKNKTDKKTQYQW